MSIPVFTTLSWVTETPVPNVTVPVVFVIPEPTIPVLIVEFVTFNTPALLIPVDLPTEPINTLLILAFAELFVIFITEPTVLMAFAIPMLFKFNTVSSSKVNKVW